MQIKGIVGAMTALAVAAVPAIAQAQLGGSQLEHVVNKTYENRYGQTKSYGTDQEFGVIGGRQYLFAGTYTNGLQIFDIEGDNAADPQRVGVYDCAISQGDVQVFTRDDYPGRTFVTYTADSTPSASRAQSVCYNEAAALGLSPRNSTGTGKQGTFIADVTDPANPVTVSFVPVPLGSHNQTVHPSGKFLYNSNSELITNVANSAIEVFSIEDFKNPKLVTSFTLLKFPGLGNDSHDITFSADGTRAYSAALSHEEIIDTTNPAAPKRVGTIVDPAINVWHQSDPITIGDRRILVVEDEFAGATGTNQCPNGGVHFYDITGPLEAAPVKVGTWNIADTGTASGSCTAHVFRLHDEQDLMTISYYNAGVRVVDLKAVIGAGAGSVSTGAKELAAHRFPNSNSWSAKTPKIEEDGSFYLYSNDINRGLDVYHYDPTGAPSTTPGTWTLPGEQMAKLRRAAQQDLASYKLFCLLNS